ncbi:MAG: hypothetical protein GDA46_00325 [Bdellovibrionales bacterium]|nr:hypothetical protein [Bdellovibrionales bacterium]
MTDQEYEKWLHNIYLEHYEEPISYNDWNDKINNLSKSYQLQYKDNFWNLSGTWFKDSLYWSKLWVVNPTIENPHRIFEGDSINLNPQDLFDITKAPYGVDVQALFSDIQLEPHFSKPALKAEDFPPSLPEIPLLEDKSGFDLSGLDVFRLPQKILIPYYLSDTLPPSAGEIIGTENFGDFLGVMGEYFTLRLSQSVPVGTVLTVFKAKNFSRLFSQEYEIQIKAILKVVSYIQGYDLYKAQVISTFDTLFLGDKVFKGEVPFYTFSKTKLANKQGEIIGNPKDLLVLSTGNIVYLDKGSSDGLYEEDSFYIRADSSEKSSFRRPKYPGFSLGKLKVIKTTKFKSTAIILSAKERIYVGDSFTGLLNPIDLEPIEAVEDLDQGQELLLDVEEVIETPPYFIEEGIKDPQEKKDEEIRDKFNNQEEDEIENLRGKDLDKDREDNEIEQEFQFLIEEKDLETDSVDEDLELEKEKLKEELNQKKEISLKENADLEEGELEDRELIDELEDQELIEEDELEDQELIDELEDQELIEEDELEDQELIEELENQESIEDNELEDFEEIDVL